MRAWPLKAILVLVALVEFCHVYCLRINESCPVILYGECVVNLHGKSGDGYYTEIVVGTPPQKLNALIDTGSSNVAIAAAPDSHIEKFFNYSRSTTLRELHVPVDVPYSQGSWRGRLVSDVVRLPETHAPAVRCDVALIETSDRFYINRSGWQGIVGLAYKQIALPNSSVTTWMDAAQHVQLGQLSSISAMLCGPTRHGEHHGYIEFGKTHTELTSGPFFSSPIFRPWFYETLLTNITVAGRRLRLPCVALNTDKTIVDTGTTNLRLPQKVFDETVRLLQSHARSLVDERHPFWTGKAQLCVPAVNDTYPWSLFPNVTLSLQASTTSAFELTVTSRSYLRETFDTAGQRQRCFKLGVDASTTGTVLGVVVLEGLYVRFNLHNRTVDFARAVCGPEVALRGPFPTDESSGCGYVPRSAYSRTLHIAMYVVAGMLVLICIPLLAVAVSCLRAGRWRRRPRRHDQAAFGLLVDYGEGETTSSTAEPS